MRRAGTAAPATTRLASAALRPWAAGLVGALWLGIGAGCATTNEGAAPAETMAAGGPAVTGGALPGPAGAAPGGALARGPRFDEGRALYSARCQRCHALPEPARLTPEAWPAEVNGMARKSGLSAEQATLITDFLTVASREARAK